MAKLQNVISLFCGPEPGNIHTIAQSFQQPVDREREEDQRKSSKWIVFEAESVLVCHLFGVVDRIPSWSLIARLGSV
jgi:hypothetical protein